jgi:uncharacterized membrane protein
MVVLSGFEGRTHYPVASRTRRAGGRQAAKKTPNRTDLGPLVFRAITSGFSSIAICASAHQPLVIGTILGVFGSIAGAFAGDEIRHRLVKTFGLADFGVALAEDIVAIGCGFLIVSHMF